MTPLTLLATNESHEVNASSESCAYSARLNINYLTAEEPHEIDNTTHANINFDSVANEGYALSNIILRDT